VPKLKETQRQQQQRQRWRRQLLQRRKSRLTNQPTHPPTVKLTSLLSLRTPTYTCPSAVSDTPTCQPTRHPPPYHSKNRMTPASPSAAPLPPIRASDAPTQPTPARARTTSTARTRVRPARSRRIMMPGFVRRWLWWAECVGIRGLCRWDVELQYYIGSKALRRPARALCGHYVPARSCAVYDSESLGLSDVSRSASHHRFLHLLTSSKGTARVDFSSVTVALVGDSSWGYPRYAGEQLIPLRCSLLPVIPVSTGEQ